MNGLPLLASQILLNDFLSDVPALALADDEVDPELLARPRRWDLGLVRSFMMVFGLLSSVFDLIVFALLLWVVHADPQTFRSGWFVASLLTELVVLLVLRTRRSWWRSRPSAALAWSTVGVAAVAIALPYLAAGRFLGLVPLAPALLGALLLVTALYGWSSEVAKAAFWRRREASVTSSPACTAPSG